MDINDRLLENIGINDLLKLLISEKQSIIFYVDETGPHTRLFTSKALFYLLVNLKILVGIKSRLKSLGALGNFFRFNY